MFHKRLIILFIVFLPLFLKAQIKEAPKANWQNLDLKTDGVFGSGVEKAYKELLKGKTGRQVIVAVIDAGIDVEDKDLKGKIWTNPKEIPGNGIDDDKNGYIDDVHGWNFLGSAEDNIEYDNDELTRMVRHYKEKFGAKDSSVIAKKDLPDYRDYLSLKRKLDIKIQEAKGSIENIQGFTADVGPVLKKIGKNDPSLEDFKKFVPATAGEEKAQKFMIAALGKYPDFSNYWKIGVEEPLKEDEKKLQYNLNLDYDPRAKNADEYAPSKGRFYGNAHVGGSVPPDHGCHVAGIIAAIRNNDIGINGVADNVLIMPIRTIPDGDARDVDISSAIRYAVDNGATIINMSFGDEYSTDKKIVDEAVKYALSKDVLFIHAAGNDGQNLDIKANYPNRNYIDGGIAAAWIEVGASSFTNNDNLLPLFTNYGEKTVDLFAPGVAINSTMANNKYAVESGTSMAAPVVAGIAALIRSYYPKLKATQVKDIIMKSVIKPIQSIKVKEGGLIKTAFLKEVSVSGGVINAYEALKLAAD